MTEEWLLQVKSCNTSTCKTFHLIPLTGCFIIYTDLRTLTVGTVFL